MGFIRQWLALATTSMSLGRPLVLTDRTFPHWQRSSVVIVWLLVWEPRIFFVVVTIAFWHRLNNLQLAQEKVQVFPSGLFFLERLLCSFDGLN